MMAAEPVRKDANGKVAGIILAGGLSRRMGGGDKSLAQLAGRPMLRHVAERLSPQVAGLAINANGDPSRFATFGLPVIADSFEGFAGPLAGILAGLEWAADARLDAVASVAADTPFFPQDLVSRLGRAAGRRGVISVAASQDRRHPVFALWPLELRRQLEKFLSAGNRRVWDFIETHQFVEVDFPMAQFPGGQSDPFFNVNTQADLAEAERILEGLHP